MVQPIKPPASFFSPSQLKQDIEIYESHVEGLDENVVLNHQLKLVTTVNNDLATQLKFLKKMSDSSLQSQTKLDKQYYGIKVELEKAKGWADKTSWRMWDLKFKLNKEQAGSHALTYLTPPDVLSNDGLEATKEAMLIYKAKLANCMVHQQLKDIGTPKATIFQLNVQLTSQMAQEAVTSNWIKLLQAEVE
ncbi:hypothetical protein L0F63_007517 [Massospora cicadina]|nr:hypothetical protein L0F63_007517 [Massospora cicadina]